MFATLFGQRKEKGRHFVGDPFLCYKQKAPPAGQLGQVMAFAISSATSAIAEPKKWVATRFQIFA
jgi:hypothetical protein